MPSKIFVKGARENNLKNIDVEILAAMIVSAGKIGYQVELAPHDLAALVRAKFADIIVE